MNRARLILTFLLGALTAFALLATLVRLPSVASPNYQELALLTNVLHLVDQYYVEEVEQHELIEGALEGMLGVLDPHSSYLSTDLYREIQLDTKGEFEGLGIEISKRERNGFVTVVAPIDGTPASRAGIRALDEIVAVCPDATAESCQTTEDMNLLEAVRLMRGPRGTEVMIQIMRDGWEVPRPFVIKRASIRVSSVTLELVEPGLPYIRLSQFQENSAKELEEALSEAQKAAPIRGLVLDLRDNPGGLLDQAVDVADLFLDDGLIVFAEGRGGDSRNEWAAKDLGTQPGYPIVVLVNGGSASASEIVAGALQDHHRGLLLGTETFGKGSVQTIIPLDDGSGLRLTTALYYLPSGRTIQEVRIQPDVDVEPYSEEELAAIEKQERGRRLGEEDLRGHLPGDATEAEEAEEAEEPEDAESGDFQKQLERDRQLARAIDLLKSWRIFSNLDTGSAS
ncbi:MAG: S41 family peptidase [Myxococcota bacterium]|nr:S41 family peptidase [Myxococcota bacterium]